MAGIDLSQVDPKMGGGLEEEGLGAAVRAQTGMESAALSESEREQYNARVKGANKSGMAQLGAMAGAVAGSYFGPLGTAAGGMIGGMVGGAF
jgi:hypothetical protein